MAKVDSEHINSKYSRVEGREGKGNGEGGSPDEIER